MNADQPGVGPGAPGQEISSSRLTRRLLPILIGLVIVLALGCGAVYAVQYLKQQAPEKKHPTAFHGDDSLDAPQIAYHPIVRPTEAAAEPEAEMQVKSSGPVAGQAQAPQQYEFFPPEPVEVTASVQPLAVVDAKIADAPGVKESVVPATMSEPQTEPEEVHEPPATEAPVPPKVDAEMEAMEKARLAALERSASIGRLVQRIEAALAGSPGAEDPKKLLDKLARIKGKDHPYVAKMRAYWHFQRSEFNLAQEDLLKVVAANPDDYEAGMNLVLIDIHHQRYKEAMARLKKLRHAYPENAQIADLIKRLR